MLSIPFSIRYKATSSSYRSNPCLSPARALTQSRLCVVAKTCTFWRLAVSITTFHMSAITEKCNPVSISSTRSTPPRALISVKDNAKRRFRPSPTLPIGTRRSELANFNNTPREMRLSSPRKAIRSIAGSMIRSARMTSSSSEVNTTRSHSAPSLDGSKLSGRMKEFGMPAGSPSPGWKLDRLSASSDTPKRDESLIVTESEIESLRKRIASAGPICSSCKRSPWATLSSDSGAEGTTEHSTNRGRRSCPRRWNEFPWRTCPWKR